MNIEEAQKLRDRIHADLPPGCLAAVQSRMFSNRYTVKVMWLHPTPGLPDYIPGMPHEITSYRQWRGNRSKAIRCPEAAEREKAGLRERVRNTAPVDENGCWIWGLRKDGKGYGRMSVHHKIYQAHRVSYEAFVGPIPEGLQLDHLCKTPACVNPEHLEPVTCRENLMRGNTIAAARSRQTHCIHGHLFDAANTYRDPNGCRICRTCVREARKARKGGTAYV